MTRKFGAILFVGVATLALAVVCYWYVSARRTGDASRSSGGPGTPHMQVAAAHRPYVGKWTFFQGTLKLAGLSLGKTAGQDGLSLAGKSIVVEESGGALWIGRAEESCREMLHVSGGRADVLPGHTECRKTDLDGGMIMNSSTTVRLSMSIDGEGNAHISGENVASLDAKGRVITVHSFYDGVAICDAESFSEAQ